MEDPAHDGTVDPSARAVRRSPEQADALRARMMREGYPLADLTAKENTWVWTSLSQHRRWDHLQRLTGLDDVALQVRLRQIRQQVKVATGKQ